MYGQDSFHYLYFVAQPFYERGAQRTVNLASSENRFGAGTAFTPEEVSGDTSGRVLTFFHINSQREEIKLVARAFTYRSGR